ncbi:methyltransferase [Micromonospora sp. WMMD723]|uniref:methyltransferase n=1 Tax=Micromonospora sp. WMMD723 TaxID=3403465 RepID=UPI003CEC78F5
MTPEATLARFREYMVGPTRFMNLLSCFELGLIDRLRENPGLTAVKLGDAVGVKPDAVEQLLQLMVKEGFVAYDEGSRAYSLDALGGVAETDLDRALAFMKMIKVAMLRQMFYLTESVQTGTLVGLKEFYGFDGTLFDAAAEHQDILESWGRLAQLETGHVYGWFFENLDIPPGARVLDLLGGNGLGSIMTYRSKASPGLHVTNFDAPGKEEESLRNFREHGVEEHCSFVGGDIFTDVPTGFDVVLIKHYLDMYDRGDVLRILRSANGALEVGGQLVILAPVYPEDITDRDDSQVDFFPTFLLGCATAQGGLQKVSTYRDWLAECGFELTRVVGKDPADIPPDAIPRRFILFATKTA